jgi:hypothetical protein
VQTVGHRPSSVADLRPHGRGRGMSMIVLTKPSRRTDGRWVVSLVREVDYVNRTVLSNSFERQDAPRATEYARQLSARFPSAYVAGF